MNKDLRDVSKHMLELGLAALAHANYHSNFVSFESDKWSELSVLQAAHAAEILVKARIAQEHPLLIFEKIPRSAQAEDEFLSLSDLVKCAKTLQYSELPERLWASTGIRLNNIDIYKSFGELRNTIQHFTAPDEWKIDTVDFIYKVIDPFINECWGLYAIDFHEDTEPYEYIVDSLIQKRVLFLVSPQCADNLKSISLDWPDDDHYVEQMEIRFAEALSFIQGGESE